MTILRMYGTVVVKVDGVAIEQICITHPKAVSGFPRNLQAMVAAMHMEDIIHLNRTLDKHGFTLEYKNAGAEILGLVPRIESENVLVMFEIIKRKSQEVAHEPK